MQESKLTRSQPGMRSKCVRSLLRSLGCNQLIIYQCNIDQDLIVTTAKLMKTLGLQVSSPHRGPESSSLITSSQDAGYSHVNLDDCWAEKNRTASGDVTPGASFPATWRKVTSAKCIHCSTDKTRFSKGFNWLTDQVHSLGLYAFLASSLLVAAAF